jgi:spore coat protein U-like protein
MPGRHHSGGRQTRTAWAVICACAAAVLCFAAMVHVARAATATATLPVTASVPQKCLITVTSLSFGIYDPVVANASASLTGTGVLGLTCTRRATSITVALSFGGNASGNSRRLKSGNDYLVYELYQPTSMSPNAACTFPGSIVWGSAGGNLFTPSGTTWGASSPQNFNVCGAVAGGQDAPSGSYSDTVVATVTF